MSATILLGTGPSRSARTRSPAPARQPTRRSPALDSEPERDLAADGHREQRVAVAGDEDAVPAFLHRPGAGDPDGSFQFVGEEGGRSRPRFPARGPFLS